MTDDPYCMSCGENPDSTDETPSAFVKNHTTESCPAGRPVIANEPDD